ncbi:MAG: methyltransferase domain-containing protein [Saprospiraceae bacterium]|nr:methyltransferase domain-containing protein [Saprospiraceae bacterium]
MNKREDNAYILGTEQAELHRLGLQHQVWSGEARSAWKIAEFSRGQTILDLGCGPGFCTMELAYIAGSEGKVIGVDKSEAFIEFLNHEARSHGLNIETQCTDFNGMQLDTGSLDGVYCRWALAWISNPQEIINNITEAMKPGAVFATHEYYDWSTLQTEPPLKGLARGIAGALQSFRAQEGDIDVGRHLPEMLYNAGLEVISVRPMTKLATVNELVWEWPRSFFQIYFPKLVEAGFLSHDEVEKALDDLEELEFINGSTILCPQMVEVVAVKA